MKKETAYTSGVWLVKQGNEKAFVEAWKRFASWTSLQKLGIGTDARLLQDSEKPQRFVSIGPWKDLKSIQAWREKPEFKEFIAKARALCEEVQLGTFLEAARIGKD